MSFVKLRFRKRLPVADTTERKRTDSIPSLKIAYNNVFGYYIEVRNTHKDKVPAEWIRKQTLVNAERYITQELKEYEEKILGAEDKIMAPKPSFIMIWFFPLPNISLPFR